MNLLIHVLYVKKYFLEIIGMKNGGRGQKKRRNVASNHHSSVLFTPGLFIRQQFLTVQHLWRQTR